MSRIQYRTTPTAPWITIRTGQLSGSDWDELSARSRVMGEHVDAWRWTDPIMGTLRTTEALAPDTTVSA